jgi:hypothetical protein
LNKFLLDGELGRTTNTKVLALMKKLKIISSSLKELEKIEVKHKKKTIRAIIKSSKRDNMKIISKLHYNTQQFGNKSSLRK